VRVHKSTGKGGSNRVAVSADAVSREFSKLVRDVGVQLLGRLFYGLRHTFRTVADELSDRRAIDLIVEHRERCSRGRQIASDGFYPRPTFFAAAAHFFEQYFTRSQSRSHFFRHANSRLH